MTDILGFIFIPINPSVVLSLNALQLLLAYMFANNKSEKIYCEISISLHLYGAF